MVKQNTRKVSRKTNRKMKGGAAYRLAPMDLVDTSMAAPAAASSAQGTQYLQQRGGMAPVSALLGGTTDVSILDSSRQGPLLAALQQATAFGQMGGKRSRKATRKATRKGRKTTRKGRKGRSRKARGRKMRGGDPSPTSWGPSLVPGSPLSLGQNPTWSSSARAPGL